MPESQELGQALDYNQTGGMRYLTRADLKIDLDAWAKRQSQRWLDADINLAINRALREVVPLGPSVRQEAVLLSGVRVLRSQLAVQSIQKITIRTATDGPQDIPPRLPLLSMDTEGGSLLEFPFVLPANAMIEVTAIVAPQSVTLDASLIKFPWPDVVLAFALASLMEQKLDTASAHDDPDYQTSALGWRSQAMQRKQELMLLVYPPPAPARSRRSASGE